MNERLDPPEDSDRLDETTARDQAREEVDHTPQSIAWWLLEECGDDVYPLDGYALARIMKTGQRALVVPELLIGAMNAPLEQAWPALLELRAAFRRGTEDLVADRADDLLRQQAHQDEADRQLELVADERAESLHKLGTRSPLGRCRSAACQRGAAECPCPQACEVDDRSKRRIGRGALLIVLGLIFIALYCVGVWELTVEFGR